MTYSSIRIEGNIISPQILDKLEQGDYAGQGAKDYGFESKLKVKDDIQFAWVTAKDYWKIFQRKLERLPADATRTTETRNDWIRPLLELLGYKLEAGKPETVGEKSYPISNRAVNIDAFPIHIIGFQADEKDEKNDLDRRQQSVGAKMSAHGMVQEYLNLTEHLYAIVTNGRYLRLLRDSGRIVKLSFLEFDLYRMMEDDLYADFALLYRLLHATRMPRTLGEGETSLIERYHQDSLDAGSRIREKLSTAVERSILAFAEGFLSHPANSELIAGIEKGDVTANTLYQEMLWLIYRFLFLMVTEERRLIYSDENDPLSEVYYKHYSVERLRTLSEKRLYDEERYDDLWLQLVSTFKFFEKKAFGEKIGIQPLDGDLFGADALQYLSTSRLKNNVLVSCLRNLCTFEDERQQLIRVNYGSLDVEEFGSVYEGLLEYDAVLSKHAGQWTFGFKKGEGRSSSGSHYTPEELVQPLIKHSLDYVIEEKLKNAIIASGAKQSSTDQIRQAKQTALLSIKVCDVACGSGHILLSAARRIATVLAQVTTDEEQPSPTSFRVALREVVRHCIYGVDKNKLAVELCKVALWLEAHNPGMPLTFLDHRIRCGDSIVGLARREEIERGISTEAFKTLPGDDKEIASMFRKANKAEVEARIAKQESINYETEIGAELKTLVSKANELQEQKDDTVEDFHRKREFYSSMQGTEYWRLKNIADLQVSQFFIPKTPEKKDSLATDAKYFDVVHNKRLSLGNFIYSATAVSAEKRLFHWFLEFPEVFEQGGFDCILGNPPFLGGNQISGAFGDKYLQYLRTAFEPIGAVDLVTYFFRRVYDVLSPKGFQALLATNTIAQGDAREGGLDVIVQRGGTINYAVRSMRWPGTAAVVVAQVAIHKGIWKGDFVLGFNPVKQISTYLDDAEELGNPIVLKQNENKSFQGSIVLGKGFILTSEEAERLIKCNSKNKEVLFPYLNGDDLNSRPDQSPSRWVINFFDWPLARDTEGTWNGSSTDEQENWLRSGHVPKDYPNRVATDFPDCFDIVEKLVKSERQRKDDIGEYILRKPLPERWWHYGEKRPGLYRTIASLERVLVTARVTKYLKFTATDVGIVFADQLVVLAESTPGKYISLNSSFFEHWSWKYCSTMGASTIRFAPTDAYENFPFKENNISNDQAEMFMADLSGMRSRVMKEANVGFTDLYNLFHNPKLNVVVTANESKQSQGIVEHTYQDILKLRQIHKEIDEAVLTAYGWSDLDLEHGFHEVEYLPENDRVRYTISEKARKEVLRRLLELNHKIHEEELKAGLREGKKRKTKGKKVINDTQTGDLFG